MKKVLVKATMSQWDPLFYLSKNLASSVFECEESPVGDPGDSWEDHMEFADGLAEWEPGISVIASLDRTSVMKTITGQQHRPSKPMHPYTQWAIMTLKSYQSNGHLLRRLTIHPNSHDFPCTLNWWLLRITCMCSRALLVPCYGQCLELDEAQIWSIFHSQRCYRPCSWSHPIITVPVALLHSHHIIAGSPPQSWVTGHKQAKLVVWAPSTYFRYTELCL